MIDCCRGQVMNLTLMVMTKKTKKNGLRLKDETAIKILSYVICEISCQLKCPRLKICFMTVFFFGFCLYILLTLFERSQKKILKEKHPMRLWSVNNLRATQSQFSIIQLF